MESWAGQGHGGGGGDEGDGGGGPARAPRLLFTRCGRGWGWSADGRAAWAALESAK